MSWSDSNKIIQWPDPNKIIKWSYPYKIIKWPDPNKIIKENVHKTFGFLSKQYLLNDNFYDLYSRENKFNKAYKILDKLNLLFHFYYEQKHLRAYLSYHIYINIDFFFRRKYYSKTVKSCIISWSTFLLHTRNLYENSIIKYPLYCDRRKIFSEPFRKRTVSWLLFILNNCTIWNINTIYFQIDNIFNSWNLDISKLVSYNNVYNLSFLFDSCALCHEELLENNFSFFMSCTHSFHTVCMYNRECNKKYSRCPICLNPIDKIHLFKSYLKHLPSVHLCENSPSNCNICFDKLFINDNVFYSSCKHIYHTACIYILLRQDKNALCPRCQKNLSSERLFPFDNFIPKLDEFWTKHDSMTILYDGVDRTVYIYNIEDFYSDDIDEYLSRFILFINVYYKNEIIRDLLKKELFKLFEYLYHCGSFEYLKDKIISWSNYAKTRETVIRCGTYLMYYYNDTNYKLKIRSRTISWLYVIINHYEENNFEINDFFLILDFLFNKDISNSKELIIEDEIYNLFFLFNDYPYNVS